MRRAGVNGSAEASRLVSSRIGSLGEQGREIWQNRECEFERESQD